MKRIILAILMLAGLCSGTTRYFLPVSVESSNGRPILNADVDVYDAGTSTKAEDLTWLDAGRYYWTDSTQVPAGSYDIYVNGIVWQTSTAISYGIAAGAWNSDISDSLALAALLSNTNIAALYLTDTVPNDYVLFYTDGDGIINEVSLATIDNGVLQTHDSETPVMGLIDSTNITNGTIDGEDVADSTITGVNIATGGVNLNNMAVESIDSSKLGAGVIYNSHIAAETITDAKLVGGSYGYGYYGDGANGVDFGQLVWDGISSAARTSIGTQIVATYYESIPLYAPYSIADSGTAAGDTASTAVLLGFQPNGANDRDVEFRTYYYHQSGMDTMIIGHYKVDGVSVTGGSIFLVVDGVDLDTLAMSAATADTAVWRVYIGGLSAGVRSVRIESISGGLDSVPTFYLTYLGIIRKVFLSW